MVGSDDIWSEWLRHRRFGGDANYQRVVFDQLKKLASKIVERAQINESATVLDIGSGDGLVGLIALTKLGSEGKMIFSDISEAALAIPLEIFNEKNIHDSRVEFLVSGIENLSLLPNGSVDRVLMRAVLLYVEDKQQAFNEIFRVLRNNGIAVISEPINQRHSEFGIGFFRGYRLNKEPLLSVQYSLERVADHLKFQNPKTFYDFNEHDLVHNCINAGFEEINLDYSLMRSSQSKHVSWEAFMNVASNPHAPTLRESLTKVLTAEEFDKVENILKKVIQQPSVNTKSVATLILEK